MDIVEVGRSELKGRTFGVVQRMERRAGLQVLLFMAVILQRTGYRLTPNEGRRSRHDQRLVWNAYALYLAGRGPWAPRAAPCYTSIHDELLHGNAIDFGGPGGAVIPADVHAAMEQIGPAYGVIWTGRGFGEWWHFEVKIEQATIIADPNTTPAPAGPTPEREEDDMQVKMCRYQNKPEVYAYADGSPLWMHCTQDEVDRIHDRYGSNVEVVDGPTFNLLRDLARSISQNSAHDVWAFQIADSRSAGKKTAANMQQLLLNYGRDTVKMKG